MSESAKDGLDPQASPPSASVEVSRQFLQLTHICESTGCQDVSCYLCKHNPVRQCKRHLKPKYLTDEKMRAACGAELFIEVVDSQGQKVVLPDSRLQVDVLDGEKYRDATHLGNGLKPEQLAACRVDHKGALMKKRGRPGAPDEKFMYLTVDGGQASLTELQFTVSSESLLKGRAPTFLLFLQAVDAEGNPLAHVEPVATEEFVVATKRVRGAMKSDIPSVSDRIDKLVHMGKMSVQKLRNLEQSAREAGMASFLPSSLWSIQTIEDFRRLVSVTEVNRDVERKVCQLLKMYPERWSEVVSHAMTAVEVDMRPRLWRPDKEGRGLLFSCKNGAVMFDLNVEIIEREASGQDARLPDHGIDVQTLNQLKEEARKDWRKQHHPNWSIFNQISWQVPQHTTATLHNFPAGIKAEPQAVPLETQPGPVAFTDASGKVVTVKDLLASMAKAKDGPKSTPPIASPDAMAAAPAAGCSSAVVKELLKSLAAARPNNSPGLPAGQELTELPTATVHYVDQRPVQAGAQPREPGPHVEALREMLRNIPSPVATSVGRGMQVISTSMPDTKPGATYALAMPQEVGGMGAKANTILYQLVPRQDYAFVQQDGLKRLVTDDGPSRVQYIQMPVQGGGLVPTSNGYMVSYVPSIQLAGPDGKPGAPHIVLPHTSSPTSPLLIPPSGQLPSGTFWVQPREDDAERVAKKPKLEHVTVPAVPAQADGYQSLAAPPAKGVVEVTRPSAQVMSSSPQEELKKALVDGMASGREPSQQEQIARLYEHLKAAQGSA